MRFNIQDYFRGSISDEQIKAILSTTPNTTGTPSGQISDINAEIGKVIEAAQLFSKQMEDKSKSEEKTIFDKNLFDLKYFAFMEKLNILLILKEHVQADLLKKLLTKQHHARIRALRGELGNRLINQEEYEDMMNEVHLARFHQLLSERMAAMQRAAQLISIYNDLTRAIVYHESNIRAARVHHTAEALKHIDNVHVDGVHTFQGMTKEQKEGFIAGWFELEEIEQRLLMDVERKIQTELQRISEKNGGQVERQGEVAAFPGDSVLNLSKYKVDSGSLQLSTLQSQTEQIRQAIASAKLQLGDTFSNQFINTMVHEDVRKKHIEAFIKHPNIGAEIGQFKATFRSSYGQVQERREERIEVTNHLQSELQFIPDSEQDYMKSISRMKNPDPSILKLIEQFKSVSDVAREAIREVHGTENSSSLLSELDQFKPNDKNELKLSSSKITPIGTNAADLSSVKLSDLGSYSQLRTQFISKDTSAGLKRARFQ